MNLRLIPLMFGLFSLSLPLAHAQPDPVPPAIADAGNSAKKQDPCNVAYNLLLQNVYQPNWEMDSPSNQAGLVQTDWQQTRAAFQNRSITSDQLKAIFEGPKSISSDEIDALYFAMLSGVGVKSFKPGFLTIVKTLQQINRKFPSLFNGQKGVVERLQRILNEGELQTMSTDEPSVVQKLKPALIASIDNILAQMLREMKGWGYRNTLFPHIGRSIKLVEFLERIVGAIDALVKADGPVADALRKHRNLLLPEEIAALEGLQNDTPEKIRGARDELNNVFQSDLTNGTPVMVGQLKLRQLEERLDSLNAADKLEECIEQAIQDCNTVEKILRALRKRQGFDDLDYPGLEDYFLQIRHAQYAEATGQLTSKYENLLDDKAPKTTYTVQAKWDVNVRFERTVRVKTQRYRRNDKGELVEDGYDTHDESRYHNESFEEHGQFKATASYGELLNRKFKPSASEINPQLPDANMYKYSSAQSFLLEDVTTNPHPVSATNESATPTSYDESREAQILAEAARMIDAENAVRKPVGAAIKSIEHWIEKYETLRTSTPARDQALTKIDETIGVLIGLMENESKLISGMDDNAIRALWSSADPSHFRRRAQSLAARNVSLIQRLKFFREQVRRQMESLTSVSDTPKYAPVLKTIEKVTRTRQIWSGVRHGILTLAIAAGIITYQNPAGKQFIQDQWHKIASIFSHDDRNLVVDPGPIDSRAPRGYGSDTAIYPGTVPTGQ